MYGMKQVATARAAAVYRAMPADERQEFRLPALLKEHLGRVVALSGQSITEYIMAAVAERVTQDLATTGEWTLTVDEQAALLRIFATDHAPDRKSVV